MLKQSFFMKYIILLLTIGFILFSCAKEDKRNYNLNNKNTQTDSTNNISKDKYSNRYNKENPINEYPLESKHIGQILTPTIYHNDEIDNSMFHNDWVGLYRNDAGFYTKKTDLTIEPTYDPIVDSEGQKTGWEIRINEKKSDSCYFLISNVNIKLGQVNSVKINKKTVPPNQPLNFTFNDKKYEIFSTARVFQTDKNTEEYFSAEGYRMYLLNKTENKKTLISAQENFDDSNIEILFIGDLDGDDLPDLIIDNSRHYNAFSPTLYLSSYKNNDELLKIVAEHISVGC